MEPLLAALLGGWDIVLILAVVIVLLGAKWLPGSFGKGFAHGLREFRKATKEVTEELQQAVELDIQRKPPRQSDPLVLWIAQGFGSGRIPWAPGTFGSVVGLLWFGALLSTQNVVAYLLGTALGAAAAIPLCAKAERILGERDPSSIVLDEICAVPVCFVPWVISEVIRNESWPPLETFFGANGWYITLIIFVLFRLFDIAKPWPVRQSQRLPGGWGVVTDDVLAALYVCALSLIVFH